MPFVVSLGLFPEGSVETVHVCPRYSSSCLQQSLIHEKTPMSHLRTEGGIPRVSRLKKKNPSRRQQPRACPVLGATKQFPDINAILGTTPEGKCDDAHFIDGEAEV